MKDPATQQQAVRNPFWSRSDKAAPVVVPTLEEFVQRGAIILVCDFAMGHLSARLATKTGRSADEVHADFVGRSSPARSQCRRESSVLPAHRTQGAGSCECSEEAV